MTSSVSTFLGKTVYPNVGPALNIVGFLAVRAMPVKLVAEAIFPNYSEKKKYAFSFAAAAVSIFIFKPYSSGERNYILGCAAIAVVGFVYKRMTSQPKKDPVRPTPPANLPNHLYWIDIEGAAGFGTVSEAVQDSFHTKFYHPQTVGLEYRDMFRSYVKEHLKGYGLYHFFNFGPADRRKLQQFVTEHPKSVILMVSDRPTFGLVGPIPSETILIKIETPTSLLHPIEYYG